MESLSSALDIGLGKDAIKSMFTPIPDAEPQSANGRRHTKVSVVGVGHVGMTIAQTILTQDLAEELALVDANPDKLLGEVLDLQHAAAFLPRTRILHSTDCSATASSDLVVIAAGARRKPGEGEEEMLRRNVELFQDLVPQIAELSPGSVLLVVSNPVDMLTYVAWKLSGFPSNRVIGSGTNLDSSRFRFLLADYLDVNAQDVQAYMVGEHGDNSVALWSSISIGGAPVLSYVQERVTAEFEREVLERTRRAVVGTVHEVLGLKGYTSWAIGYSVASLARAVLRDQRRVHPVSLLATGLYGVGDDREVFLSLPAQLGVGGVVSVANVPVTEEEERRIGESAERMWQMTQRLDL